MQADADRNALPPAAPAVTAGLSELVVARWRKVAGPAALWALVGSIAGSAWTLPTMSWMIEEHGHLLWLLRGIWPAFVSAFILIVALSISVGSGAEMARRPAWFLLVLALGAAAATAAIWAIDLSLAIDHRFPLLNRLLSTWLTIMLFGGGFGWAAVLNITRTEEQAALTQLLMQRSLLTRQVAQAKLFAARAQVDPEMVARVLNQVRTRYRADARGADMLLDQLIDYLRLAMNRMGQPHPALVGEIEMVRAYAMLREVETSGRIDLQVRFEPDVQQQQPAAAPLFLLVRQVLKEASPAPGFRLVLQLHIGAARVQLTLETGLVPLDAEALLRLRAGLRELFADRDEVDILHHLLDTGVHRYVVQAAID